ncbi:lck-interacting transmembrane adapter 1 isoform X1 [Pteropus vampyrus]|uniref:Lck-interacting transmembrane adapter 1 isoform X1 n=1 Tax=Pteropus vampyrus TaxID=132908 RepID=A0A6P3QY34_PTEVA|nr:lck-interacting transmembrane adapter 1 isoform X1 [Pteropus vampyrus]
MGPQVPSAPSALWALGCLALLLWLWVLCTACHRKAARRQQARLQGWGMPAEAVSARLSRGQGGAYRGPTSLPCPQSLLRRPHLCSLSKSDTRLHELHQGRGGCTAPRPASMDLLCLQYLEMSRGTTRPLAAFSHRELPQPSISPEATYSNVGLAAIPRASLAASPVVWAGARLTSSCARPGPEARPVVPEYARIQKLKGTGQGPQGVEQAEGTPATQVDILYSKVNKPRRRDPEPVVDQLDPKSQGAIPTLGSNVAYDSLPLRGVSGDKGLLENVYESIQEMGIPERQEPPRPGC